MTNIYVGNLRYTATEDDIRQAFEEFGEVTSVNIIMDRETGRSRGFAFVEMADAVQAKAAIEGVNLQEVAGRRVNVPSRGAGGVVSRAGWAAPPHS